MRRRLDRDLTRWEAGTLSGEELQRLHPDDDLAGLVDVHEQLSGLVDWQTPDAAAAWTSLEAQLSPRAASPRHSLRWRSRRAAIAAIAAAVLAVPAVSYAAAPRAVRSVVREVRDLLPGTNNHGDHGDDEAPITTVLTTVPTTPEPVDVDEPRPSQPEPDDATAPEPDDGSEGVMTGGGDDGSIPTAGGGDDGPIPTAGGDDAVSSETTSDPGVPDPTDDANRELATG